MPEFIPTIPAFAVTWSNISLNLEARRIKDALMTSAYATSVMDVKALTCSMTTVLSTVVT